MGNAEEGLDTTLSLATLGRPLGGAVNDQTGFTRWLDANLFEGATFGQTRTIGRPRIWTNASDIYNRTPFVFGATAFSAICNDLAAYPVSGAAAASAAVPIAFAPVVVQAFPGTCSDPLPQWILRARGDPNGSPIVTSFARRSAAIVKVRCPNRGRSRRQLWPLRLHHRAGIGADTSRTANAGRGCQAAASDVLDRRCESGPVGRLGENGRGAARHRAGQGRDRHDDGRQSRNQLRGVPPHDGRLAGDHGAVAVQPAVRGPRPSGCAARLELPRPEVLRRPHRVHQLDPARAAELEAIPTRFRLPPEQVEAATAVGRDALRASPALDGFLSAR